MQGNIVEELKAGLKRFTREDILFSQHALLQAVVRQIDVGEVTRNILNPTRLVYARKEAGRQKGEVKYDAYFSYGSSYAHRYIFTSNGRIIIVTVIKIRRDWQKMVEWYEKIRG